MTKLRISHDPDALRRVVVKGMMAPVSGLVKVPVMVVTPVAALKTAWRLVTVPRMVVTPLMVLVRVAVPPEFGAAAPAVSGVIANMVSRATAMVIVSRRNFMVVAPLLFSRSSARQSLSVG